MITRQILAEQIESQPKAAKSGFHGASDSSVVTIVISCYAKNMAAGPSSSLSRSTFLFVRLTESESCSDAGILLFRSAPVKPSNESQKSDAISTPVIVLKKT